MPYYNTKIQLNQHYFPENDIDGKKASISLWNVYDTAHLE